MTVTGYSSTPLPADPAIDAAEAWIRGRNISLDVLFAHAIRQALDEVIDGGRTGRWSYSQLEKTEKTYVGTKIEILVRTALGLPRERPLDTVIAGHPIDIKWSGLRTPSWQIPTEAVDELNGSSRMDETLFRDQPMGAHGLHNWWYGCLQRAGLVPEGVTSGERMHKARHTAGQRLLDATGNLKAVQKLLGHESIQTTGDIYTDWDVEQLADSLLEAVQDD